MCSLVILLQIDFLGLNIAQAQEKSHAMYFIMASDKIALLPFLMPGAVVTKRSQIIKTNLPAAFTLKKIHSNK